MTRAVVQLVAARMGAWLRCCVAALLFRCVLRAGELAEPSKKMVQKVIEAQDALVENAKAGNHNDETQLMGQIGRI